METPRHGHLCWVSLDKRRPALVLSPDYRDEHADDVIVRAVERAVLRAIVVPVPLEP